VAFWSVCHRGRFTLVSRKRTAYEASEAPPMVCALQRTVIRGWAEATEARGGAWIEAVGAAEPQLRLKMSDPNEVSPDVTCRELASILNDRIDCRDGRPGHMLAQVEDETSLLARSRAVPGSESHRFHCTPNTLS
jgi:hypothetical protein